MLEPAGYSGLIVNTDNDLGRERALVESLRSRQVEGLIVATALIQHPLLEQLHGEGVKMVMVNRRAEGIDASSIAPDDNAGVALAVERLAQLGHRRIAHLAGPATTSTGVVRARAFRNAVRDQAWTTTRHWSRPATTGPRRRAPAPCVDCSTSRSSSARSSRATT